MKSELRVSSREWFASVADDVVVGHIQCTSHLYTNDFLKSFPHVESTFNLSKGITTGCLNMAFKVDREMNQNGQLLPEISIRVVHWRNRRDYERISEPKKMKFDGNEDFDRNRMAFSLSHAPTCSQYMHRFVESCGVIVCSGAGEEFSGVAWGENDAGLKAIICNNADDAVVVSTSVIGNYPHDPAACHGQKPGTPYISDVSSHHFFSSFTQF